MLRWELSLPASGRLHLILRGNLSVYTRDFSLFRVDDVRVDSFFRMALIGIHRVLVNYSNLKSFLFIKSFSSIIRVSFD